MSELAKTLEEISIHSRVKALEEKHVKFEVELGKKVNWHWFFGVLLTVFGLQLAIYSAMWSELKEMREKIEITSSSISAINGKLQPFDFILDDK